MDRRERVRLFGTVLQGWDVDPGSRIASFYDEDSETEHTIVLKWVVCVTCDGSGKHVNPSIDANGLTQRDFDEDPEFLDEYMRGSYDVDCYECKGRTTILAIDLESSSKSAIDFYTQYVNDFHSDIQTRIGEMRMGA
jgi:hypothetical protein